MDVRLGAVSSIASRTVSLISPSLLNLAPATPGSKELTNASSLADIDGQIGLGPARLKLFLDISRPTEGKFHLTDSW